MLSKEKILELLETLDEHKMAKDIFAPTLKAAGLKGVRFTGGPAEEGIDIEYYELTQPEKRKSWVGVQFKKGSLVYQSSATSKNSVQTVKIQAEEAFSKEMIDLEGHAAHVLDRFVVAVTREINEPARRMISKARQRGEGRRIDFWDGDRLAEFIQTYWLADFEEYFAEELASGTDVEDESEASVVDADYIAENHADLIAGCKKVRRTINRSPWAVVRALLELSAFGDDVATYAGGPRMVPLADLLEEIGTTEDRLAPEFEDLRRLGFIDWGDDSELRISGKAKGFWDLARTIKRELVDAEEDESSAGELFDDVLP